MDSNAVIDFLGGILPESGKHFMMSIIPEISVITFMEILSKKDLAEAEIMIYRAFANASVVYSNITSDISEQTISIRKQYGLKMPDALIAATALVNGLKLITRNEKDFAKNQELAIVNPWQA